MKQAIFKIGSDKRKNRETVKGRVIKEYPSYYLIQTESGYKECIDKTLLVTGEIERMK